MSDKLSELRNVMDGLNAKKLKEKPGDDMPAAYFAGERTDLLNPGIIPSDNIALNNLIGGGPRRGAFLELVGKPHVGKTNLAFDCISAAQKEGATVVYLLSEGSFPEEAARLHGADLDRLVLIDGFFSAEEGLNTLKDLLIDDKLVRRKLVDMVVIDSISGMRPAAELKAVMADGFEKDTVGRHAAMWSKAFPIILPCMHNTAIVMINQYRNAIGSYGSPQIKTGGHAAGYYPHATIKVSTTSDDILHEDGKKTAPIIGHRVHLRVEKNKHGKPYGEAEYDVFYETGTDNILPLFYAGCAIDSILEPSKGWYTVNLPKAVLSKHGLWKDDGKVDEPRKIQGLQNVVDVLRSCDEVREIITAKVYGRDVELDNAA